jgi:formylglycine-generating enzyme required for sulfatase activity
VGVCSTKRGKDEVWAGTSDEKQLGDYAVFLKGRTEPVGNPRKPNAFGLYDMSGNVWESVEDCWHRNYDGAPSDGRAWKEENGGECGRRVVRDGSWYDAPELLRASFRYRYSADFRYNFVGFRLAQDIS